MIASKASADADFASDNPKSQAAHAASHAAYAAGQHTNQAVHAEFAAVFSTRAHVSARSRFKTFWKAVTSDAAYVARHEFLGVLPLWHDGSRPLTEQWRAIKWQVANSEGSEDWQFWIDWYDSLLDGRPMLGDAGRTWEMLERIALIDPETWDKGPEAVNPVIRGIWELHRLRAEVAALQAEKVAFLAARASEVQRGHNQPPEGLVDDAPEVARQITIIWDGLDEAREELERDAPDKGRLHAIAQRMLAALKAVVAYCGKVADRTVTSAAEAAGKFAGRAAVVAAIDHVAMNGRLSQFIKDLISFGSAG